MRAFDVVGMLLKQYLRREGGHIALWTALMAVPMLAGISLAIDHHLSVQMRTEVKAALDAAAIAAVTNQAFTEQERKVYAKEFFEKNFDEADNFTFNVIDAGADRFEVTATGTSPVSLSGVVGVKKIAIQERSVSMVTREHVICVLTLNPDGRESFSLFLGANFNSPECAVQVNSSHAEAAFVDGGSKALAKDFCVTGGASGNFTPYVNTQCAPIADPYMHKTAPEPGSCIDLSYLKGKGKNAPAVVTDNVTLKPGTYCEDLSITGKHVSFLPGTYIMRDSEIWMRKGSTARAQDVTLVLNGEDSMVFVEQGSSFYIKAPSEGDLAGLAIFQDKEATVKTAKHLPSGTTMLTGGSTMTIIGTVYVPTQTIEIWGNSAYNNTSPATSYIGYNVSMGKNSSLTVNVDHAKAGLPPILPRSDEGARIVQ